MLKTKDGLWRAGCLAKLDPTADNFKGLYDCIMTTVPRRLPSEATAAGGGGFTLADFGYKYIRVPTTLSSEESSNDANRKGVHAQGASLRHAHKTVLRMVADPSRGFQWLGQKHYDAVGDAIVSALYEKLAAAPLPSKIQKEEAHSCDDAHKASTATPAAVEERDADDVGGYGLVKVMVPLAKGESAQTIAASHFSANSVGAVEGKPAAAASSKSAASKTARREATVPIFVSPNVLASVKQNEEGKGEGGEEAAEKADDAASPPCDTILLIMQGSGAVRPSMWARALCMNASLEEGTVFEYIQKAYERGWGVIVTNPNENRVPTVDAVGYSEELMRAAAAERVAEREKKSADASSASSSSTAPAISPEAFWLGTSDDAWKTFTKKVSAASEPVRGSETPMDHSQYVYETFVMPSRARRVLIVAHSFGGICVGSLLRSDTIRAHIAKKCPAIAFTDACNDVTSRDAPLIRAFYKENVVNWVASAKPLNTPLGIHRGSGCEERSAGHQTHEWTSTMCIEPLFEWLDSKLAASQE